MDVTVSDYSAYLTPERLAEEERLWEEVAIYRLYAEHVQKVMQEEMGYYVVEVGCGTGWVPTCLPPSIKYLGIDANPDCIRKARAKTARAFVVRDIRSVGVAEPHLPTADLVCSFAVLKHFALREWADVLAKVLSLGRHGLFTMNVGPSDVDDFEQGFPHTWVSPATLVAGIVGAGHRLVSMETLHTEETMVRTEAMR